MTPEETAARVQWHVVELGGAFMRSRPTRERGSALGLHGWTLYVAGRGGVLGDVDADVVAAALVFFRPEWVRGHWEAARRVLPPAEAAREYAEASRVWARRKLAGTHGLERLAELAERVVRAGHPYGRALFAGWRALPLPGDPPGRLGQLLQVLREHRGNGHALAVLAEGLSPLEALMAGPRGRGNAAYFEWPEPYPDPAPFVERWRAAEMRTNRLAAHAYAALDERERDELAALLDGAAQTANARR